MQQKQRDLKRFVLAALTLAGALSAVEPAQAKGRPYSDSEIRAVETSDDVRVRDLRNQEVTQLRVVLGRRQPQNRLAEIYFRLAQIYAEAYRQEFILEGRAHEKRLEKGMSDLFIDRGRSKPYLELGIKACREILGFRIPYEKLDQVQYFLGFNLNELGRTKEASKAFDELIKKYPRSMFAGEAMRELGEIAYNSKEYRKAIPLLEQALPRSPEDRKGRVLHRLAWSYYRTKQYDRALATMKKAIDVVSAGGEKYVSLKEEALRDMAVFMTESGRVDEAIAYFEKVSGDQEYYPRTLERLGKNYERNAEPDKASHVYDALLRTRPNSEEAFRVLVKLIDLDLRRGHAGAALARLARSKIDVKSKSGEGDSETEVAYRNLKAMIRRTGTENHQRHRKKSDSNALGIAESYYQTYLSTFLSSADPRNETPEIQMLLAEVKRDLGKSKEAGALYRKVLEGKDARYAKEAGALWTASLAEAIREKSAGRKAATEPSTLEREYIEATDHLIHSLPETQQAREAALRAAQLLAAYPTSRPEAISRSRKLIDAHPTSSQAITAARLWMQLVTDDPNLGDFDSAAGSISQNTQLMRTDAKSGGKLKVWIQDLSTKARLSQIAKEEKGEDFGRAAQGYEQLAKDTNEREIAEKALANAVGAYLKDGDSGEVSRVTQGWLKRYPKSAKAVESIRSVATFQLIKGDFAASAKSFEFLGTEGQDSDALETSGRIADALGDARQAAAVWSKYLEIFARASGKFRVALRLARLHESKRMEAEAIKAYRLCAVSESPFEAECLARLGDLQWNAKTPESAKATWVKASALKKTPAWVGYVRYRLAEVKEAEGRFDPIAFPEAALKKALDQRLQFLETLSRAYGGAVDAGGPFAVAALDRLARWVKQFADQLDAAQPAPGMDEKALTALRRNLRGVSEPLRKKALQSWMDSYQKAVAAEALSPALPGINDEIAFARGASTAQGGEPTFRLAAIAADGGKEGAKFQFQRSRDRLLKNAQDAASWVDYGNLLWGEGRPGLARLAYDRALSIQPKNPSALNNRAVVGMLSEGLSDWSAVLEGQDLLNQALKIDDLFLSAKMNKAALLNFFRVFSKARPLWEQINSKGPVPETLDGEAVANEGEGRSKNADSLFARAEEEGGRKDRIAKQFVNATRAAAKAFQAGSAGKFSERKQAASRCVDFMGDIDLKREGPIVRASVERWKTYCDELEKSK